MPKLTINCFIPNMNYDFLLFFDGYQHGDSVTVAAMIEKIHATVRFDHLDEISVDNRGEALLPEQNVLTDEILNGFLSIQMYMSDAKKMVGLFPSVDDGSIPAITIKNIQAGSMNRITNTSAANTSSANTDSSEPAPTPDKGSSTSSAIPSHGGT